MTDVFNSEKRSEIMRAVRSKGNKSTELRLLVFFRNNRITGWRRNYPLRGHPDFVFPKLRVAVFVDGCFWHGHDCRNTQPHDNSIYWTQKRNRNIAHDKEINTYLADRGWTIIRIWECELNRGKVDILMRKAEQIRAKALQHDLEHL